MITGTAKIAAIILLFASVFAASSGWCSTRLSGDAELAYTKYDATENGRDIFSGNSLSQRYSLMYQASNLYYRSQPTYYDLMAGYDLVDFSTKVTEPDRETGIKQNYGRIKYSGDIGYNALGLPIRFRAFINDNQPLSLRTGLFSGTLISDGLIYNLEGRGKIVSSGVSMAFEPETSRNATLRALPRLLLEYRETTIKNSEGSYKIDNRLKELAVGGLNRENNWVHYRFLEFENHLSPTDKYTQQQIQLGLVDHRRRRLWSALTNWIEVSADAQLTDVMSPNPDKVLEEYDVNFMAIAKRKKWNARSFMNYNRELVDASLTEVAKVPVYVRGIYGAETDWHVSLTAVRGRQHNFSEQDIDTSSSNSISIGGTTFKHKQFTLSPSASLNTYKSSRGYDSYSFNTSLETASTSRFSNKLWLGAIVSWKYLDDGSNTAASKTWSGNLDLTATYRPTGFFTYTLKDKFESGSGYGFLDPNRVGGINGGSNSPSYIKNFTQASVGFTPNSRFATSLDASYDIIQAADVPVNTEASAAYKASYDMQIVSYAVDTRYIISDNGVDPASTQWNSSAQTRYRPDRYTDALLRFSHEHEKAASKDNTRLEILQKYSYNFFTRKGAIRNVATLTEEYSFVKQDITNTAANNFNGKTQYLMISGRYSPTDRYTLFGSAKYQKEDPAGSVTMYYNAGMSADFRLLSTSIEYTLAKRDIDNRIEKKLAASVRRSF